MNHGLTALSYEVQKLQATAALVYYMRILHNRRTLKSANGTVL